jgi:transcription elongation GreA/GreB family factor
MAKTVLKKVVKKRRPATVADITSQMAVMAVSSTAEEAAGMTDEAQAAQEEEVEKTYSTWKYSEKDKKWHYYEWYSDCWWRRNLSWTRMTEYF